MSNLTFNVCKRENNENKVNLRRVGLTPGIIYGEFLKNPIPIKIDSSDLKRLLKTNNKGSIIPICLGKKKLNCVVKDLQKNYRNEIKHQDLQYTKPNERIKMKIPIKFSGQENLESKRLVLETHITSIELQGDVEKIPESIDIDVSNMNFDNRILLEDISIPKDISVLSDPKALVAIITN